MFGLRALWHKITSSPETAKIETEVKDFFSGAASYLLHQHGAEVTHLAVAVATKTIQAIANLSLTSNEKHAEVSQAIHNAVVEAGGLFSASDINLTIEAGLTNVKAHNDPTIQPQPQPPTAATPRSAIG